MLEQQDETESFSESPADAKETATIARSYSVEEVAKVLAGGDKVTSIEIARVLLKFHGEYAGERAPELLLQAGELPAASRRLTANEWIEEVTARLAPGVPELHGRLLLLGLARVDPAFATAVGRTGLLSAIEAEIKEQPVSRLFREPDRPKAASAGDAILLIGDSPTADDRLARRPFAKSVARRLSRTWHEFQGKADSSFIVHLQGPWGAGKTSFLRLLNEALHEEPAGRKGDRIPARWIVVQFNAWQHQRLQPPWWFLLDGIYRSALREIKSRIGTDPGARRRALRVWGCEQWWRLVSARSDLAAVGVVAAVIALAVWLFGGAVLGSVPSGTLKEIGDYAESLGKIGALVATIGTGALLVWRTLASRGATAARAFMRSGRDPMARVARHFCKLLRAIDSPIAVLVDDLDRCNAAYVTSLLEGIQTLFSDPRIFYVIAADRRWLHACFDQTYEGFRSEVHEPGRTLGALFLQKAVQLSVPLPSMPRTDYWEFLLASRSGAPAGLPPTADLQKEAHRLTSGADALRWASAEQDPARRRQRVEVVLERLADPTVEAETEHFLGKFSRYLEPNPRAMKRYLNAYAIQRDLALLGGISFAENDYTEERLALWTILIMRWPALEDFLLARATGLSDPPDKSLGTLFESRLVQEVWNGGGTGHKLTFEDVAAFGGTFDRVRVSELLNRRAADSQAGPGQPVEKPAAPPA